MQIDVAKANSSSSGPESIVAILPPALFETGYVYLIFVNLRGCLANCFPRGGHSPTSTAALHQRRVRSKAAAAAAAAESDGHLRIHGVLGDST